MLNVDKVLAELNLDGTDEEVTLITDLLAQAEAIVSNSVNHNVALAEFESNAIFQRVVITLATDLYYHRTLPDGLSLGTQMMINHLKGVFGGGTTTTTIRQ